MNLIKELYELTSACGLPGAEDEIRELSKEKLNTFCDSIKVSNRGNLLGIMNGVGPKIVLDAHMDQVGLIVTEVCDNGFVLFDKCGGIDERCLSALEVEIISSKVNEKIYGIISTLPPHLRKSEDSEKTKKASELAIDTGLTKEDAEKLISKGDRILPKYGFIDLLGNEVSSGALDDRSGMLVILRTLEIIDNACKNGKNKKPNVLASFSVCEEVAGRGASTNIYDYDAEYGIVVDVSFDKTPGCSAKECGIIGKGPMIGKGPVVCREVSLMLESLAKEKNIPFQFEIIPSRTGTHADELATTKTGIKVGMVSLPLKYMHTPIEVINTDDVENSARLIAEYCLSLANEKVVYDYSLSNTEYEFNKNPKVVSEEYEDIKEISDIHGVSGREDLVRQYIIGKLPHDIEYYVDNIGNLIVKKIGKKVPDKKVMFCAHMDEVGLIATYITEEGLIKVDEIGGICEDVLVGKTVTFESGVTGVIGLKHIHLCEGNERTKIPSIPDMYVDIGVHSKEEAEKSVALGDYAVFNSEFVEFGTDKSFVKAKALDDRLGCSFMLELINSDLPYDTYFAFTTQEEVGSRGAICAANGISPDISVVLETTTAGDIHGVTGEKRACVLGDGPVVSYMDRGTVYDKDLYNWIMSLAKENGIKVQTKTLIAGGNDSSSVQRAGSGSRVIAVSLPTRYLHSAACVINKSDVKETGKLLHLIVEGACKI